MRLRHLSNTYLILEALEAPDNDDDEFGDTAEPTLKERMVAHLVDVFGECDQFEIEAAIYWYAHNNYTGQADELYSLFSLSQYSPSPLTSDVDDEEEQIKSMYYELCEEYGPLNEALEAPENDEDDFGEGDDNLITRIYVLGDDDIYVEVLLANSGKRYYRVTSYSKQRYGQPRRSTVSIYEASTGNEVNKNDLEFLEGIEEEEAPASEYDELCWLTGKMKDHLGMYDRDEEFNRKCW